MAARGGSKLKDILWRWFAVNPDTKTAFMDAEYRFPSPVSRSHPYKSPDGPGSNPADKGYFARPHRSTELPVEKIQVDASAEAAVVRPPSMGRVTLSDAPDQTTLIKK